MQKCKTNSFHSIVHIVESGGFPLKLGQSPKVACPTNKETSRNLFVFLKIFHNFNFFLRSECSKTREKSLKREMITDRPTDRYSGLWNFFITKCLKKAKLSFNCYFEQKKCRVFNIPNPFSLRSFASAMPGQTLT